MSKEETPNQDEERLRMEVVNEMFKAFDEVLVKFSTDHEINFLEIETTLTMLRKKLDWEQLKVWLEMMGSFPKEDSNTSDTVGMYK